MKEKIKGYLKKLLNILKKPELAILPANIAFYLILAIIPLLTVIVLLASSFGISIDMVANLVNNIMPKQASDIIIEVISGKGFDRSVGVFNIMAFILASNGTYAIINTSDALYKVENSDWIKKRISSIILLIIIIILFVFLIVVPIFGANILTLMSRAKIFEGFIDEFTIIFDAIKWPLTMLIVYFNIKLVYTMAPSKNIKSEETTYGAAFTTIVWALATFVFSFYLNNFARYDILYGSLSSLIIMMVWVYFLSYIFVLGMAINASRKEEQINKEEITICEDKEKIIEEEKPIKKGKKTDKEVLIEKK